MIGRYGKKPNVLFFTPILEYPPAGGPQLRVVNAIKALNKICKLHIVTSVGSSLNPDLIAFIEKNCASIEYAPTSVWNSRNPVISMLMRRSRRVFSYFFAIIDVNFVINYAEKIGAEIFWVEYVLPHSFGFLKRLRKRLGSVPIIADTDSVYSRFILRELPYIRNPFRYLYIWLCGKFAQAVEERMLRDADVVTAVSDVDQEHFKSLLLEKSKVKRFSNVIDLNEYQQESKKELCLPRPNIILMGSFGHSNSPMDRASKWLLDEIMPLVWKKKPEVNVVIIGRNSEHSQFVNSQNRVLVVGTVKSVVPYLQQADLTVVPLGHESGTRFKIIESGALALPCVSTTLGAEGLAVEDEKNIIIADTTRDFAISVMDLLNDDKKSEALGRALNVLISQDYSIECHVEEGKEIISYLEDRFNKRFN